MKLIVCKNYDEMSAAAAAIVAETVKANPACVLGLATGSTPVGMYKLFSGGIYGKVHSVEATTVDVEISNGVIVTVEKSFIQALANNQNE